jgi:hypothetical protein
MSSQYQQSTAGTPINNPGLQADVMQPPSPLATDPLMGQNASRSMAVSYPDTSSNMTIGVKQHKSGMLASGLLKSHRLVPSCNRGVGLAVGKIAT